MAKGIAVLQAALAGRGVRFNPDEPWRRWDPVRHCLVSDGHPTRYFWAFALLWEHEWDIEPEVPMTFTEAQAVMETGRYVRFRSHEYRWNAEAQCYEWRRIGWDGFWYVTLFTTSEVRETGWMIGGAVDG